MPIDTQALYKLIGHRFENPGLLLEALTHPSISGPQSYQRLEFLGDRVLGLCIAETLLQAYPEAQEGMTARRYNMLVRRETLADISWTLGLQAHIRMNASARHGVASVQPAILADVLEAMIGALYLDGGLDVARRFIGDHWAQALSQVDDSAPDAKSALQEWAQGRGLALPIYAELNRSGPDHAPHFTIEARLEGGQAAQATGRSKREAEQAAAAALLDQVRA